MKRDNVVHLGICIARSFDCSHRKGRHPGLLNGETRQPSHSSERPCGQSGTGTRLEQEIAERRRVTAALEESERRDRTLVSQVRDYAIFGMDAEGWALTWNEGVEAVLGYGEEEFIGASVELPFLPEDVAAGVPRRELEIARREGVASDDRWLRRKDGTRFYAVGLTTRQLDGAGRARTASDGQGPALSSEPAQIPRRQILVVDDNRDAASALATLLTLRGQNVLVAYDGLDAIDKVKRLTPDVVLMDLGMPELDGVEAVKRLRALPAGEKLKIIALTGRGQLEDLARTRKAGFDLHLVKPVDVADLERALLML